MLNKLLKSSLILVLAISLTACAGGKKKKPGKDIGDDNVSAESDLGKLLEDRVEQLTKASEKASIQVVMTKSDGTTFEIKKENSQINGGDQQKWKEGWSVNFPADISKIKNFNYTMSTSDASGTDDLFSAYDQDGNLVTDPEFQQSDNFIKDGKNNRLKTDFSKITKLFRVYTFVLKESGIKSYKIYPTVYISHTA